MTNAILAAEVAELAKWVAAPVGSPTAYVGTFTAPHPDASTRRRLSTPSRSI